MAPIEGPLFMPFQTSIDNSYVSNVESQQVHGTPSAASPSRSLMFRSPLPSCRTAARQKRLQARDNAVPFSRPQFDPVHDAASPYHSEGAASGQRTTAGLLSRQSHADLRLSLVAFDQFALENPTAETEFAGRLSPRGSSYQAYSSSQAPGQPQPAGVAQNLPREVTSLSLVDPAPDASLQRIIMPDASAHDQMLSYRAVCDLNALASAASQTCPLYHDGDSGYGGSAMSSQSSMATSAMPIPFGDRETTDPAIRSVSLGGPERPNNVPARPLGGHRTALPDEAPLPAAATGSNPTTRRLPVLDSTSDKVVVDNPPVGTNRRPHTAGQKRSAESEGSDHRLSRKRHNPPTMDAEHEHNTDLHSPVPESTNNSIWELGPSSEHQTDRTIAIEETPGLGVFASSSTAYNDNRDNGESNASNDFSALVSVDSFATVPNAPVEVDHPHHVSNVQTYGVGWGPLDWADSSGQQAEPDLPDFTLCPADLDLKTQNMQSYGVSWGPLDWADSSGQQAVPNVFEPNLTGSGTGENAQS
ncbi:hypothetical protein G3M48_002012 [Beauveria asiatica]|uniref:Uncharacterized protein n=1 Tax=Beauveria asiatica TaxID=1069075 RepID=A0AAW0RFJ0_9HYPO